MNIRRVAVIYNGIDRPETTGTYVRRCLGELVEVEHVHPGEWQRLPKQPFDLYLRVDDGYEADIPRHLRPLAFWVIDTHMDLERYLRVGHQYDLVFAAQRDGAVALQKHGIKASWLPLGCDPFFHRKHDLTKIHDLCFIGNMIPGDRASLVYLLKQQYPSMLVDRRYFADMAKAYSSSKIVFNRSIKNDVNMRVFEGVACGSLLMTNDLTENGLAELFQDGVHLATYQTADDLLDKVKYYLKHDDIREKVAQQGMAHAHEHHTYKHRVEAILQAAESLSTVSMAVPTNTAQKEATYQSDPFYYGYVRQEILDLVPLTAKRILDIGCGAGRLGEVLKVRQRAHVTGVEAIPAAAAQAKMRLDVLYEGDIESLSLTEVEPFDAIVCADVLEHLKNPLAVLRHLRNTLSPEGHLIVSLPNVRHHSVVRGLLEGHWTYEPAGLLDETHLRFFTRREIEKMLFRAGYQIEQRQMTTGAEYSAWVEQGRPGEIRIGSLSVGGMTSEEAEEFHAYQYLFTAKPRPRKDFGKTSIILITHNGIGDTRECISSFLQLTDHPFELICIDNGSTDGTPEYLETLANTTVIRNSENRGFPAAVNQGLELVTGEQILLLNNDTVLTTGWLTHLLEALYADDKIGLVGPVSNCAPGAQRVRDIPYAPDLIGMDGFAWDIATRNASQREETDTLSGFCLLFRTELYQQLGRLDERYGIGTMEDDDYCLRASQAGWKVIVAKDVYIHHAGHRTFQALGMDFDALAEQNRRRFSEKWSPTQSNNQWGLTSIIIPVHGQLAHTQKCIESIRRHTAAPYELIVIDNASPDETQGWLKQQSDITVIANPSNKGFPAAVNQGLRMAQGHHLLVLNNDTVVTAGWLDRLLEALHAKPNVGIVGPCTNRISGEQQIPVNYDETTLQGLQDFSEGWAQTCQHRYESTDRLVGFCMLLKRAVLDKVGNFDEQFGIGNFEDDDFCKRAIQAGFQLLIARDSFIHHIGHATFKGAGIDFPSLMKRNQALFEKKWHAAPSATRATVPLPDYQLADTGSSGNLLLQRKKIRLSLCMIVRNNAKFIIECLSSILPYVDEIIVVDTGSTDNTAELAQSLGARVYHFPWCDSFSAARNESLKYARGEWIFWMDSDDVISPECGLKLRSLAYQEHPENLMGFFMQVHCLGAGSEGYRDVTIVDHVKLFRNRPELRFEFRMHEQIICSIRRLGGDIEWTDVFVTHANYDHTPDGQKLKLERDLKLLQLDDAENPNHTFILFNLGMTYEASDPAKAVSYLERSISAAGPGESHLRKAYAYLASAHARLHDSDQVLAACQQGLEQFPLDPELRYRRANLLVDLGRLDEAATAYLHLLEIHEDRHITSIAQGLDSHAARTQLANTYVALGKPDTALVHWKQVVQAVPWFRPGWRGYIDTLLKLGQYQQAADLVQTSAELQKLSGESQHLLGIIHLAIHDISRAGYWFQEALKFQPDDPVILEQTARYFFEHGSSNQARPYLERLLELNPQDAAALHNLGSLHLDTKDFSLAAECFKKSLTTRPKAKQTWQMLAVALRKLGDDAAADHAMVQSKV